MFTKFLKNGCVSSYSIYTNAWETYLSSHAIENMEFNITHCQRKVVVKVLQSHLSICNGDTSHQQLFLRLSTNSLKYTYFFFACNRSPQATLIRSHTLPLPPPSCGVHRGYMKVLCFDRTRVYSIPKQSRISLYMYRPLVGVVLPVGGGEEGIQQGSMCGGGLNSLQVPVFR